jgi:hypothetical protein
MTTDSTQDFLSDIYLDGSYYRTAWRYDCTTGNISLQSVTDATGLLPQFDQFTLQLFVRKIDARTKQILDALKLQNINDGKTIKAGLSGRTSTKKRSRHN